jgi:hypothetical protein
MNPSNPAKVGFAFAAGIVVALASAVIYVKTTGVQPHDTSNAAIVQQSRQPESLNAPKVDEPVAQKPSNPPTPEVVAQTPPTPAPPEPLPAKPVVRHAPVARAHYPHTNNSTESSGGIRVEVSQLNPPPGAPAPAPVPAVPPMRTVNEDQTQATPQPPSPAPQYAAPVLPPPPQPHTVTLQPGTNLVVRLAETISTEHNYSGDTFRATLDRPIVLDGFVIAEKGSKVLGKIVTADKAGKLEGTANLQLVLTEINTTDGQHVRVETGFVNRKGPTNTKNEAEKIGGGAVLGAIIGAIAGGGKGAAIGAGAGGAAGTGAVLLGKTKPAVVQTETQLTFQLSSPTTITEKLN